MEYVIGLLIIGTAALGMAWMPALTRLIRVSYSLIYMLLGMLLFWLVPNLPNADPIQYPNFTLRITEMVVLVALMGSGLKIDQPFSLRKWAYPLRLVTIGMSACIAVTAFAAWYWLGLDPASAILLGAILSPTDPVLASDVQVGPPQEGKKEDVRFTLTAEGGMNDGTAFPFVWLGVLLSLSFFDSTTSWLSWAGFHLVYKVGAGLLCGFLLGKGISYVLFSLPEKYRVVRIEDGFVALSVTLLVYATAELVKGYGFIAVFVCALTLRNHEMDHQLHKTLHSFSDQIERILVAIVLLVFGGSLIDGILDHLTWPLALLGIGFLLVIRPLTTWFSLAGTRLRKRERAAISFFGIRGIGSLYYMSFAMQHAKLALLQQLWSTVAFIILLSVIIHGITANTAISKLEKDKVK